MGEENNNERRKNDIKIFSALAAIDATLNNGIKDELAAIKKQINNDLQHQIAGMKMNLDNKIETLNKDFTDYQINQHKWTIGIFVSIVFLLGGIILSIVIK
jgi:hypothetical protein